MATQYDGVLAVHLCQLGIAAVLRLSQSLRRLPLHVCPHYLEVRKGFLQRNREGRVAATIIQCRSSWYINSPEEAAYISSRRDCLQSRSQRRIIRLEII